MTSKIIVTMLKEVSPKQSHLPNASWQENSDYEKASLVSTIVGSFLSYSIGQNLICNKNIVFLRFGHPDPEGSGRVSQQDCIQMPSYHLKPKSAL